VRSMFVSRWCARQCVHQMQRVAVAARHEPGAHSVHRFAFCAWRTGFSVTESKRKCAQVLDTQAWPRDPANRARRVSAVDEAGVALSVIFSMPKCALNAQKMSSDERLDQSPGKRVIAISRRGRRG